MTDTANDNSVYEGLLDKPAELVTLLKERDREIQILRNAILNANRQKYGAKTEKLAADQIAFSFNVPRVPEQQQLEKEIIVPQHKRTIRKGRKPLPTNLPHEEVVYEPEETHCACCKAELVVIGEERSEELEKIPAQLKVITHIRIKKACRVCKGAGVLVPPLPPTLFPLERARPGAGLLADIIVSKYVDHLPLFRQEEMYRRRGIELPRARMCDWVAGVVDLLGPLYVAHHREIVSLSYVHADETTLKVQDGEEKGKCHTGYLWGLVGPPNLVWFHYARSRAGEVPLEILKGYQGAVHTDAYAGYNPIFLPERCVRVACLAHVRRKFIEVQKIASKEAQHVLKVIAEIYHAESGVRDLEERRAIREKRSRKTAESLMIYLKDVAQRTLPRSPLQEAIQYTLKQEVEILRIFADGRYDLDNNAIERQMRPVAIGRKNYMFAGSHDGARRAAVLYSLLNTCKLNKVDPWEWLSDVLRRISSDQQVTASTLAQGWVRKKRIIAASIDAAKALKYSLCHTDLIRGLTD